MTPAELAEKLETVATGFARIAGSLGTFHDVNLQADLIRQAAARLRAMEEAMRAVNSELWWCAIQLGCNWKDKEWREKSSVGRAYDHAVSLVRITPVEATAIKTEQSK